MSWLSLVSPFRRREPAVEPAGPRDAAAFAVLHAASFARGWSEQEFEQLLIERNALAHRVRLGRSIVGFIVSRCAGDEAEILSVAVAARHRGRGLAGRLLRTHLGELAGIGVRAVFLEVEETNRVARQLYARGGFRDVGRRANYYRSGHGPQESGPQGAAAVVMRRDLT
ncbi:MAG: ribosomal-protein-alanine N-acetyltransferase [Xanthobacteraceae bacterium]|nr:MAG: ribosomal-protein-alanine N-acetyltransferase [Xanthobacteraceae bacterium]